MKRNKIIYAEDEPFLAQIVSDGLKSAGYEITYFNNGQTLLRNLNKIEPELFILDVLLPGADGFELAEKIREIYPVVPIIFLTAKTQTDDVIKGFKSGGNDYLKKPFSMDELIVRIESLLERFNPEGNRFLKKDMYYFGNSSLDTIHHILTTPQGKFDLSYKETALLELLLLNANKVSQRSTLLREIWGNDNYYTSRSMDVHISQLRKRIAGEKSVTIMNLRGVGYKLTVSSGLY